MVKGRVTLETLLKEAGLEESEKHRIGEDGSLEQGTPPVEPSDADRAEAAARAAADEARKLEHPLGVAESALALARARVLQSLPTPQAAAQLEQSMPYSGELADPTKVFYAARTLSSAASRELSKDNDDQPSGTTDACTSSPTVLLPPLLPPSPPPTPTRPLRPSTRTCITRFPSSSSLAQWKPASVPLLPAAAVP